MADSRNVPVMLFDFEELTREAVIDNIIQDWLQAGPDRVCYLYRYPKAAKPDNEDACDDLAITDAPDDEYTELFDSTPIRPNADPESLLTHLYKLSQQADIFSPLDKLRFHGAALLHGLGYPVHVDVNYSLAQVANGDFAIDITGNELDDLPLLKQRLISQAEAYNIEADILYGAPTFQFDLHAESGPDTTRTDVYIQEGSDIPSPSWEGIRTFIWEDAGLIGKAFRRRAQELLARSG